LLFSSAVVLRALDDVYSARFLILLFALFEGDNSVAGA